MAETWSEGCKYHVNNRIIYTLRLSLRSYLAFRFGVRASLRTTRVAERRTSTRSAPARLARLSVAASPLASPAQNTRTWSQTKLPIFCSTWPWWERSSCLDQIALRRLVSRTITTSYCGVSGSLLASFNNMWSNLLARERQTEVSVEHF